MNTKQVKNINAIVEYKKSDNLLNDVKTIIESGKSFAFKSVDTIQIYSNCERMRSQYYEK